MSTVSASSPRRRFLDWSLAIWVKISLMSSLSTVLMLAVQVPLFPSAPFLTYDLSEVPALVAGFALGPVPGMAVVVLKNLLFLVQRPQPSELVGIPMNLAAGMTMVGVSSGFYWKRKTRLRAMLGLALGAVTMAAVMVPVNLMALPLFAWLFGGVAKSDLVAFVLVIVTPFNLVKGALSGVLTFLVYKRISAFLKTW